MHATLWSGSDDKVRVDCRETKVRRRKVVRVHLTPSVQRHTPTQTLGLPNGKLVVIDAATVAIRVQTTTEDYTLVVSTSAVDARKPMIRCVGTMAMVVNCSLHGARCPSCSTAVRRLTPVCAPQDGQHLCHYPAAGLGDGGSGPRSGHSGHSGVQLPAGPGRDFPPPAAAPVSTLRCVL